MGEVFGVSRRNGVILGAVAIVAAVVIDRPVIERLFLASEIERSILLFNLLFIQLTLLLAAVYFLIGIPRIKSRGHPSRSTMRSAHATRLQPPALAT